MEPNAYILIMQYLRAQDRGVSPNELSETLGRSRVTIQATLKRLIENGWVEKIGESPKTTYKARELSLVPHETQEREGSLFEKQYKKPKNGLLEEFISKIH